jgi:hypothetical protein
LLLPALLLQVASSPAPITSARAGLAVRLAPGTALVERDPGTGLGFANFDLLITNGAAAGPPLELASIVMTAHDRTGALLLRRLCDTSGLSPCIRTVPDWRLDPGATGIVYNPFHELRGALRQLRGDRPRERRIQTAGPHAARVGRPAQG